MGFYFAAVVICFLISLSCVFPFVISKSGSDLRYSFLLILILLLMLGRSFEVTINDLKFPLKQGSFRGKFMSQNTSFGAKTLTHCINRLSPYLLNDLQHTISKIHRTGRIMKNRQLDHGLKFMFIIVCFASSADVPQSK